MITENMITNVFYLNLSCPDKVNHTHSEKNCNHVKLSVQMEGLSGVGTPAQISAIWGQTLHFHFFLVKGTTKVPNFHCLL